MSSVMRFSHFFLSTTSSYLEQTVSPSHRSWRSWKVFPNEVDQRAKSLLRGCGQLETVEHVLKECPLHSAELDYLKKVSPELNPKTFLGIKKNLGIKFWFRNCHLLTEDR
jgi:hypothetical protein